MLDPAQRPDHTRPEDEAEKIFHLVLELTNPEQREAAPAREVWARVKYISKANLRLTSTW